MFTFENVDVSLSWIVGVGSSVVAILSAVRWIYQRLSKVTQSYKEIVQTIQENKKLSEQQADIIKNIEKELQNNGGSSVKDTVQRIESRLIALESKNRISLIEAPWGVFETDEQGLFVSVNRTYCRLAGLVDDEMVLGNGWIVAIPESDKSKVRSEWKKAVFDMREFEMRHKFGASRTIDVTTKAYPIKDKHNEVKGWYGFVIPHHDIHKCPLLEAELNEK